MDQGLIQALLPDLCPAQGLGQNQDKGRNLVKGRNLIRDQNLGQNPLYIQSRLRRADGLVILFVAGNAIPLLTGIGTPNIVSGILLTGILLPRDIASHIGGDQNRTALE